MDKSWIQLPDRFGTQYTNGIDEFITVASVHKDKADRILCPCRICKNRYYKLVNDVKYDLEEHGMDKSYTRWVYHDEELEVMSEDDEDGDGFGDEGGHFDGMQDLLEDLRAPTHVNNPIPDTQHGEVGDNYTIGTDADPSTSHNDTSEENPDSFDRLLNDARQPLYPRCGKFSKLDFLVKLLHTKIIYRWSNKSFDTVLQLIKAALPTGETLPASHHEAKQLMRGLGLGYIPIHACVNDCVLFWKTNEDLESCPECNSPRYKINEGKNKRIPQKVLRYFPLTPRLQRLFRSRKTAVDMRWHKEKRVEEENVLRHPADSKSWKEFDKKHEWFAIDPRNVRLGLASDGFNPFGDMSNQYSMWPVMVMPYNFPPWKSMKEPFIFMSLLIPGRKSPGNDIDVYLQPLIDELKDLWVNGVETYDVVTKKTFQMHVALLWTINDFPAYGNLSGWSTKGKLACPNCNKDTVSMYLKNGKKLCYMANRRFLPPRHPWRTRGKELFDGKVENRQQPKELPVDQVLLQLNLVEEQKFGKGPNKKKRKRAEFELNWTKKSIFFRLPYWETLELRHNLNVMHIEKNICDNVLGTLMSLEGKNKDSVKARLDLAAMGIREEFHVIPKGNKFVVPPACYAMSSTEIIAFCEWLKLVKFLDGYASNISRCVNTKDGKILGMKSHDCHVLLQRLLPVGIRGCLSNDVCTALNELGTFFKELCCKTLRLEILEKMEKDIALIICKLEQIFPPAFFDVMVHLAVHLPHEAIYGGPVQYRWMYPIERFLHTLKQYVRNKAHPEGSIAEAYVDTECLTFCSMYLQGIETRFNREERNFNGGNGKQQIGLSVFKQNVRPLGASRYMIMDSKEFNKARYYVVNNTDEVLPYLEQHKTELNMQSPHNLEERQETLFPEWFKHRMQILRSEKSPEAIDELYSLACGPDNRVNRYSRCIVSGIRFHTRDKEVNLRTQNSGVVVEGCHESKEIDFYGILIDVIVLDYIFGYRVFLFQCDWWDVGNRKTGIHTDRYVTSVNVSWTWNKDDRFVLATQAAQVFYVSDTKLRGSWQVVQKLKPRNVYDVLEREDEIGVEYGAEAYQEEEQLDDSSNGIEAEEVAPIQLNREDLNPSEVDATAVRTIIETNSFMDDDFIVNDGETDEEDDTLVEYCNYEEEGVISSDDDSDLD